MALTSVRRLLGGDDKSKTFPGSPPQFHLLRPHPSAVLGRQSRRRTSAFSRRPAFAAADPQQIPWLQSERDGNRVQEAGALNEGRGRRAVRWRSSEVQTVSRASGKNNTLLKLLMYGYLCGFLGLQGSPPADSLQPNQPG